MQYRENERNVQCSNAQPLFLDTPTVFPRRPVHDHVNIPIQSLIPNTNSPVVFVCWPLTLRPQKWRRPRCALIFFRRSKSSRSLESSAFDRICEFFPSTISFCLLRNHVGILNWVGFWIMVTILSNSSGFKSPALYHRKDQYWAWNRSLHTHRFFKSTSAFLQTTFAYRRPTPRISVSAYLAILSVGIYVTRFLRLTGFCVYRLH